MGLLTTGFFAKITFPSRTERYVGLLITVWSETLGKSERKQGNMKGTGQRWEEQASQARRTEGTRIARGSNLGRGELGRVGSRGPLRQPARASTNHSPFRFGLDPIVHAQVYNRISRQAMSDIKELQERVESGEVCPSLGSKADSICNQARASRADE